jgi:hypothetical protein
MVYSNKCVVAVLVNGQVQKELADGTVQIPFNSEYVLRFRNKNDRRAVVKFTIDGENVSGSGYVIEANSYTDIRRHSDKDVAFKFVSLDSEDAIDFGKNGPNTDRSKGVIEASFYLEKERPKTIVKEVHHHHDYYYPRPILPIDPYPYPRRRDIWYSSTIDSSGGAAGGMPSAEGHTLGKYEMHGGSNSINFGNTKSLDSGSRPRSRSRVSGSACSVSHNETFLRSAPPASNFVGEVKDGCTVEGNYTGQTFTYCNVDTEETCTTLRIVLKGYEPESVQALPSGRKTNKDRQIEDLEEENRLMREKLARIENEQLKEKLETKPSKKVAAKKKPSKSPRSRKRTAK